MNVFEFLLVVVSIVLGLGITELLAGFVRILRGELVAGKVHALWLFVILQLGGTNGCVVRNSGDDARERRRSQRAAVDRPPPANACSIS